LCLMTGPFSLPDSQSASARTDIGSFLAFATRRCGILHSLTVLQGLKTLASDLGMMDKQILTTVIGSDKAEPLLLVEPLYGTSCHVVFSLDLGASTVQVPSVLFRGMLRGKKVYTLTSADNRIPMSRPRQRNSEQQDRKNNVQPGSQPILFMDAPSPATYVLTLKQSVRQQHCVQGQSPLDSP